MRVGADQVLAIDEYLHPRLQEICETLPAGARPLAASGRAGRAAWSSASRGKGRVVTTSSLRGFLMLYAVAGHERWRRATLRYRRRERGASRPGWREIAATAAVNPALAVEVAQCQRLVKGYSDTHERGLRNFETVMAAVRARRRRRSRRPPCASCATRRWPTSTATRSPRRWRATRWPDDAAWSTMSTAMATLAYRDNPDACARWCEPDRVHRDLYIDPELFALEQEHFFANTWNYVGHDSQLPNAGRLHHASRSPAGR